MASATHCCYRCNNKGCHQFSSNPKWRIQWAEEKLEAFPVKRCMQISLHWADYIFHFNWSRAQGNPYKPQMNGIYFRSQCRYRTQNLQIGVTSPASSSPARLLHTPHNFPPKLHVQCRGQGGIDWFSSQGANLVLVKYYDFTSENVKKHSTKYFTIPVLVPYISIGSHCVSKNSDTIYFFVRYRVVDAFK